MHSCTFQCSTNSIRTETRQHAKEKQNKKKHESYFQIIKSSHLCSLSKVRMAVLHFEAFVFFFSRRDLGAFSQASFVLSLFLFFSSISREGKKTDRSEEAAFVKPVLFKRRRAGLSFLRCKKERKTEESDLTKKRNAVERSEQKFQKKENCNIVTLCIAV